MVFHDLVNPCPTTSLTLSHVEKQGYRGGSVGGSFSCGRSGAIRDFKGMGGQTHGPLANRRLKSIQWQCRCPHQNDNAAPRRIQQPRLPFINSETGEAPRKVRPGSKGNHLKVNKVPGQGLTMSRDLTWSRLGCPVSRHIYRVSRDILIGLFGVFGLGLGHEDEPNNRRSCASG